MLEKPIEISDIEANELLETDPEQLMREAVSSTEELRKKKEQWNEIAQIAKEILADKAFIEPEEVDELLADRDFREKARQEWPIENADKEALAKGLAIRIEDALESKTIH